MTALLEDGIEERESTRGATSALYVSTSLEQWQTSRPAAFARDVQVDDTAYRSLDPEYYAWLRSKMALAKSAATAGKLPADEFDILRVRFNAIHEWAMTVFGEARLLEAIPALDARTYKPPVAEPWKPHRPWILARSDAAGPPPQGFRSRFYNPNSEPHRMRPADPGKGF
jgi:hypothetical protein